MTFMAARFEQWRDMQFKTCLRQSPIFGDWGDVLRNFSGFRIF